MLRTDDIPINAIKYCNDCKHKLPRLKCKAFPDGIPQDVLYGERDHHFPIEGDNGFVFEPVENKPPRAVGGNRHG